MLEPVEGSPQTSLTQECQDALRNAYVSTWQVTAYITGRTWQELRDVEAKFQTPESSLKNWITDYPGDEHCPDPELRLLYHEVTSSSEKWADAVKLVAGLLGTG